MIGTLTAGFHIVIAPLLALTADQMRRIRMAVQTDAATLAYHLDELSARAVQENVIPCITALP